MTHAKHGAGLVLTRQRIGGAGHTEGRIALVVHVAEKQVRVGALGKGVVGVQHKHPRIPAVSAGVRIVGPALRRQDHWSLAAEATAYTEPLQFAPPLT